MSGSVAAAIVTPIVAFGLLAVWIGSVLYADSHPDKHKQRPDSRRSTVSGGSFTASGGHQVMPHRDEPPPEALQYQEQYQEEIGQRGERTLLPTGST